MKFKKISLFSLRKKYYVLYTFSIVSCSIRDTSPQDLSIMTLAPSHLIGKMYLKSPLSHYVPPSFPTSNDGCSDHEVDGQFNVILMKKNSQNSLGQFPIIHQNPIVYDPHLVFKSLIHSDKLKNNLEFICHGNMNSSCCEIRYFPL